MTIAQKISVYLKDSANKYIAGQHEYYACLALQQALAAHQEGNYGIGAVAVVVQGNTISEFPNRNTMFSGVGLVDHAETRALLDIRAGKPPARTYARNLNAWTLVLQEGISVFGSLEPCPMCACVMTNAGTKLSVSTVLDGKLITSSGFSRSDGGATAIEPKNNAQPQVWQWLQQQIGLEFELLKTNDAQLLTLSAKIFEDNRELVDSKLASSRI